MVSLKLLSSQNKLDSNAGRFRVQDQHLLGVGCNLYNFVLLAWLPFTLCKLFSFSNAR